MKRTMKNVAAHATKTRSTLSRMSKDDLIKIIKNAPIKTVETGKNIGTAVSIANRVGGLWGKLLQFANIISKIAFIASIIKLFQKYIILRKIWFWSNVAVSTLYFLYHFAVFGWGAFAVIYAQIVFYWTGLIETLDWKFLTWIGSWFGSIVSFLSAQSEKALEEAAKRSSNIKTNKLATPSGEKTTNLNPLTNLSSPKITNNDVLTDNNSRNILSRFWIFGLSKYSG